jgi:hypothetical protein
VRNRRGVDAGLTAALVTWLASGSGDMLNGRFLHTLDDVGALVERIDEVRGDDLYAPRVRRLDADAASAGPGSPTQRPSS